jgi:hypothetical protein
MENTLAQAEEVIAEAVEPHVEGFRVREQFKLVLRG